jgi:acetyltransferase-like isoleucine patch superfamily enzyme
VKMRGRARLVAAAAIALLPARAKPRAYRALLGYDVDGTARIGLSIIDGDDVRIGAHVAIGHGNLFLSVRRLSIGEHARFGWLNVVRGGDVTFGRYVHLLRRNELTSILEPDLDNPADPSLVVGDGSVLTDGHRVDFTDRVELGRRVIIGGRGSSLWTHNRQRTAPISIGDRTYLGSECRLAPGSRLPSRSIVALGSVVSGALDDVPGTLIGGNPAAVIRPLDPSELELVDRPTRRDLPGALD